MNRDHEHLDLHQLINDSLDGELDEAGRGAIDERIAADADAAKEAEAWRRLDAVIRGAERISVDERAFLAEHRRRRLTAPAVSDNIRIARWLAPLAAAAAILIAVFVSLPDPRGDAPTTLVHAPETGSPEAAPTQLASPTVVPPCVDIHYGKPPHSPADDEPAPLIQVKFARRDIPVTPQTEAPVAATGEQAPVTFAVVSAGGRRESVAVASVAPPI